jgi:hypothetical protein
MHMRPVALRLISALSLLAMIVTVSSPALAQSKPAAKGKPATATTTAAPSTKAPSGTGAKAADALAQASAKPAPAKPAATKPAPPAAPQTKAAKVPPGQAKKHVTTDEAVGLSRKILVKHGFQVVRVENLRGAQVIYYRAGNNGRGRGLGPVQKMIIRPSGTIVTFEAVPERVRLDLKLQLGF